ncbi:glycine betaine ABC transporter substrate-binding protein [Conexibacter sp. JD483]|uniref:glycine betaine ABC transporter substrate-binding protein n=1 Tax=unclassified Conexibacter TaxID=2627773 RepID=UPI00271C89F5|nr:MULTISPECIES: glycine betaine ABC transporter substrate-binding protein [unclassified Conexibacter]MDO8185342.1 glycine betaine ABC transporter substrate-binding protein [Conexibacter sp. CPCC 205706]MDO8198482.1 glycine betaine ABC transporter substrate-binding protein [Conexibacter sp. CPCC 205762]MDR9368753.1 glycine betaine ABC transporter substrate-binding protein [Conexibacter sp. JD483]
MKGHTDVKQGTLRTLLMAMVALVLAFGLAACGDDDSSSSSSSADTSASTTGGTETSADGALPGEGKPAVTLGTKNFTEQFVLGQLYKQALEARGFRVNLKENIGSTEIADRALRSGQIDLYPEYIGIFDNVVAGDTRTYPDVQAAYDAGKAYAERNGFTLLPLTPFTDVDALAVTPEYSERNGVRSVADLTKVPGFRLGAAPEFRRRATGLPGLARAYGVRDLKFSPLTIGLQYDAIDNGKIDVAQVFTTDGKLEGGRYVVLTDPKNIFGFQNVTPVVSSRVLEAEGPAFAETIDAVSQKLTTEAMQRMNGAVDLDKQSPAEVAKTYLEANGLL